MIGGRNVKWLKVLVVFDVPSNNWYHYYDNKVLPAMVTNEMATEEDHWWRDERYTGERGLEESRSLWTVADLYSQCN
jgi:nitrate reductase (NAD(P)H)